ncbi:hypothetical protein JCM33374_g4863 [Metschnikowia sp. JCM 33374]|nr:hypothetical protein JCM33374_g4863 [Metschnikowia sp. JCM 33374]
MPTTAAVSQEAVFIGANKQGHVLDYAPNLVAFGAHHSVALWNPVSKDKKGVYQTLNGHTKEVTCVRFVPHSNMLVSAGEDGQIIVWKSGHAGSYSYGSSMAHEHCSITTLATVDDKILVSGASSGEISIWAFDNAVPGLSLLHGFKVKPNFFPTTLCLQKINGIYLLVVGGTSSDLFVYSFSESATDFTQCAVLSGHEDWIKCLSFVTEKDGLDYILASGSQDRYIRLWRLRLNEAIDDSDEDDSRLVLLSNKQYKFSLGPDRAAFSFEALIMGHDDWVTDLKWHPSLAADQSGCTARKLQLLSSSADTALMVWEMDADSGIWVSASRLGELSIKGASTATGASGGFWSCLWFNDPESSAQYILASGKTGAIRVYQCTDPETNTWESVLGVTGPVREVTDVVWSQEGTYVLATSLDQTTRLLAPWKSNRQANETSSVTWHEFARPQIHGYDMICVDNVSATKFVSGGDEKILRVFEMTQSINGLLNKFCGVPDFATAEALPEAASLPVLGLSNKAANEQLEAGEAQQREEDYENEGENQKTENNDVLASLQGPPLEDHLQRHTLFPELEKLYGHGYEITCCATSPSNSLIASACRSNSSKHAVIRIFNAKNDFLLVDEVLKGHNLTIVSLEFSPDGQYLIAVSRDRQFSLWRVVGEDTGTFELVELNPKAHSRIIWDCSWAPKGTDIFVTGSRDKGIKVWKVQHNKVEMTSHFKTDFAITSVACYQKELVSGQVLISVGHENGRISLYGVSPDGSSELKKIADVSSDILPGSRINKLAFSNKTNGDVLQLAVGSDDTSIRVYSVEANALEL